MEPQEPTPCPICGLQLAYINEPGRHLLICDSCGWLKNFKTSRQMGGDPRYEISRR